MGKIEGKRALVTAGAQGIGLAISRELLSRGCEVVVHYKQSASAARSLVDEATKAGRRIHGVSADLTEPDDCDRVVREAVGFLGGLDILVNNAGSLVARRAFAEADDAFWAEVMSLNIGSARRVTRAALPHLLAAGKAGGASVVNLSSIAGRKGGNPGSLPYSTAKGALLAFTRALATEVGPQGVRVNAVAPGFILGSNFHAVHTSPEAARKTVEGIPIGRAGTPEDVARAVVYLASEYDGFIHGATLDINGGSYCA
jgi:3-oxoacyl-[acyl-carrier protein] reductase